MNIKAILHHLVACILLLTVAGACRKEGGRTYYDSIPGDAGIVFSLELETMCKKSDISGQLRPYVESLYKYGEKNAIDKLNVILNDRQESGIALHEKLFVFANLSEEYFGISAKVTDAKKLEDLVTMLAVEARMQPVSKQGPYKYCLLESNLWIFFDDEQLLCLYDEDENATEFIKSLMRQPHTQSIAATAHFQKLLQAGDIKGIVGMDAFQYEDVLSHYPGIDDYADLSGIDLLYHWDFKDGQIAVSYEFLFKDEKSGKLFEEYCNMTNRTSGCFLEYFPESTLLYTSANFDGKKVRTYIEKQQLIQESGVWNESYGKLLQDVHGELAFGITQISPFGIPTVLCYAEVRDDFSLQTVAQLLNSIDYVSEVIPLDKNNYECRSFIPGISVFFGKKEGIFYLTNDNSLHKTVGTPLNSSLKHSEIGEMLSHSAGGLVVDIHALTRSPLTYLVMQQLNGMEAILIQDFLSELQYLDTHVEESGKVNINLFLDNKKQNALKTILNKILSLGV